MIVSLTGFMGSGKTSVGRELSALLSFPFIDLDEYIAHKIGKSIPDIFEEGEERFRAIEAEAVRDVVTMSQITGNDLVLALGGGTFTIRPIRELLLENSKCVYLETGQDTCLDRIKDKPGRPLLSVPGLYESRIPLYSEAPLKVTTDGLSAREVAERIVSII